MVVPLAQALAMHPDQEPAPGTTVFVDGRGERLHATLRNTCVLGPESASEIGVRHLVRIADVLIDPEAAAWHLRTVLSWGGASGPAAAQQRGRARAAFVLRARRQGGAGRPPDR